MGKAELGTRRDGDLKRCDAKSGPKGYPRGRVAHENAPHQFEAG